MGRAGLNLTYYQDEPKSIISLADELEESQEYFLVG